MSKLVQLLRNHRISIPLIVLAIAALAEVLGFARSSKPAQAAPRVLEVGVVQVEQKDVPIYSEWIGTTEGMVNAELKAQVTGYLLRQDYKEGSFVKQGQLLFEIDPRPFQAAFDQANGQVAQYQGQLEQAKTQITQAEAQLAQAQSQLQQAQSRVAQAQANQVKAELDVKKYQPLAEQKAVPQQELDNALQAKPAAKAQVDAEKAGVEAARAQLLLRDRFL